MNTLYPLKFKPIFKEKIWGGNKIHRVLGMDYSPLSNCGEVWLLSGVEGDESVVTNGFLEGNTLNELVEIFMGDLLGDAVFDKFGAQFPVLFKIIDANTWLSIQVHPDDKLAEQRHQCLGKTEMWYVMDADKESVLINGFSKSLNKEQYVDCFKRGELKSVMNYEAVKKDDVFYIPAGRVHALGPGVMLAEIQQTSDVTYRIYDWDRIGVDGLPRELHTQEALDAFDFKRYDDYKTSYAIKENETVSLVNSPHFTTNVLDVTLPIAKDYSELDSFVAFLCVEGAIKLETEQGTINLVKGEIALIPNLINEIRFFPEKSARLLEVFTIVIPETNPSQAAHDFKIPDFLQ